jgi:DNA-binding response OmpR family regulator
MHDVELLKKINLLYIEDEDAQRESVAKTLKMIVGKLFVAKDGIEGLEIFQKENIQVIFTDYMMPNLDGYKTAKEIRKISPNIPIIIASAYSEKEKLMNAIEIKAVDYIEKPLNEIKMIESLFLAYSKLNHHNLLEVTLTETLKYSFSAKELYKDGNIVPLTKRELSIIELLVTNKGRLVGKDIVVNTLFEPLTNDSVVRNCFYKLRKKIGEDVIETIVDVGYMIR